VLGLLGQGGEGKVWLARDRVMRREVAVKTLHMASAGARLAFLEEAQVTSQLEHPNILPIYEIGTDGQGMPFLVMRRVKGRRLTDLLAPDADPPADADARLVRLLGVFAKVCDAAAYAHARGVVHRDLKPGNVMIGEFGDALVLDWGLAKVLGSKEPAAPASPAAAAPAAAPVTSQRGAPDGPPETVRGVVKGTVAYMAPEQAAGRPDEIDARTDVYSLGAILYEILSGARPVDGSSDSAIPAIPAIIAGRIVRPSLRAPDRDVPPELEAVASKAMALSRSDRYQSAGELKADLERWLDGRTVRAFRYGPLARARKWVGRNRALSLGLAAALALAAAVPFAVDALEERTRAEARAKVAAQEKAREDARRALEEEARAAVARVDAAATAAEGASLAEEAYRRFSALAAADPSLEGRLSLSDLAQRRARIALSSEGAPEARLALASEWGANAYAAGPRTGAAGRALLLLARESERAGRSREALDQHHLALSAMGAAHPDLRAEALLGLAHALGSLPPDAPSPFDPAVKAREAALHALLAVVRPDGALRDDVAAALPSEARAAVAREASDLLFVLRRLCVPAFAEPWESVHDLDGDGAPDTALRWDAGRRVARLARLGPPPAPGAPLAILSTADHDWGAFVDALGDEGRVAPQQAFVLDGALHVWLNSERARRLAGPIERPAVVLVDPPSGAPSCGAQADLDVDGRTDIVLGFTAPQREVRVYFGRPGGGLEPGRPLRVAGPETPPALAKEARRASDVSGIEVADLDGDGRAEVAIAQSSWSNYSVEVWRPEPDRTFRLLAFRRTGHGGMRLLDDGSGGRLLAGRGYSARADRPFYDLVGEAPPEAGAFALRFDGHALAPEAGTLTAALALLPGVATQHTAGGRRFLGSAREVGTAILFEGRDAPLTLGGPGVTLALPSGLWARGGVVFREAIDADLAAFEGRSIPEAPPRDHEDPAARTALFLARFGLADDAARIAGAALAAGAPPQARGALARTLLRSLLERRRDAELLLAARALAPQDEIVPDVIAAADAVATRLALYEDAAHLLEAWGQSAAILPQGRALCAERAAHWRSAGALLDGAPAVAWAGDEVTARLLGRPEALAERIIAGDLALVRRVGPRAISGETAPVALAVRAQLRADAPDLRAGAGGPRLASEGVSSRRFAGVPVRFDGGPWRITADLALDDVRWSGGVGLGLSSLRNLWGAQGPQVVEAGLVVRCWGGHGVQWVDLTGRPWTAFAPGMRVDGHMRRRLRADVRYHPEDGWMRASLLDVESGARVDEVALPCPRPLEPGLYVLGLCPEPFEEPAEARVFGVALYGAARLADEGDPELTALREAIPPFALHTSAARALLAGDGEAAARALESLAASHEAVPAPDDAARRALLETAARRARFEAALARRGGDRARLADDLAALAATPAAADDLMGWALDQPQTGIPPALAAAVGDALARAPGDASPDRDALVAAARRDLPEGAALEMDAIARAIPERRYDARALALATRLVSLADAAPAPPAPLETRLALARALLGAMRRADAIRLLEATPGLPRSAALDLEVQRETEADLQAHLARRRAVLDERADPQKIPVKDKTN